MRKSYGFKRATRQRQVSTGDDGETARWEMKGQTYPPWEMPKGRHVDVADCRAGGFRFRREVGQRTQFSVYHSSPLAQHHPRLAEAGEFQRAAIRISDILPPLAANPFHEVRSSVAPLRVLRAPLPECQRFQCSTLGTSHRCVPEMSSCDRRSVAILRIAFNRSFHT